MPRIDRSDDLGRCHHVMNRGLARRTIFESSRDLRFFLSRLVRVVRSGELAIHSYSLLSTHFHLLVTSRRGHLSAAMGWIENQYVRWFNRARRRDGPLFRGRFSSFPVTSEPYRCAVTNYIDRNAVDARLVTAPRDYPWCSAWHRARGNRPRWLAPASGVEPPPRARGRFTWLVERRMRASRRMRGADPLAELLSAAPPMVAAWMRRKARLADGTATGIPVAAPETLLAALADEPVTNAIRPVDDDRRRHATAAGLLRSLCGLTWKEIASLLAISRTAAVDAAEEHRRRLLNCTDYAEHSGQLAAIAIERTVSA